MSSEQAPHTYQVPEWTLTAQQSQAVVLGTLQQIQADLAGLSTDVRELKREVAGEDASDLLSSRTIAGLSGMVSGLLARLDKAIKLAAAAKAGEANALVELEFVLAEVRQATEDLRADNIPTGQVPTTP